MRLKSLEKLFESGLLWLAEPGPDRRPSEQTILAYTQNSQRFAAIEMFLRSTPSAFSNKRCVKFNLPHIDQSLPWGGLVCGGIHEFFLSLENLPDLTRSGLMPLAIPTILAGHALINNSSPGYALWIDRRAWPPPFMLKILERQFLSNLIPFCIFADPPGEKKLLWTIEAALRTPGLSAVIAACDKLAFSASRRLALAAEKGGALGLLLRSLKDLSKPTAALSSWLIRSSPSPSEFPRWEIQLLRCKGRQPYNNQWIVELQDEPALSLYLPPALVREPLADAQRKSA